MPKRIDEKRLAELLAQAEAGNYDGVSKAERKIVEEYRAVLSALQEPVEATRPQFVQGLKDIFVAKPKRTWLATLFSPPQPAMAVRGHAEGLQEFRSEVATVQIAILDGSQRRQTVMVRVEPPDWTLNYGGKTVPGEDGQFELSVRSFKPSEVLLVRGQDEVRLEDTEG